MKGVRGAFDGLRSLSDGHVLSCQDCMTPHEGQRPLRAEMWVTTNASVHNQGRSIASRRKAVRISDQIVMIRHLFVATSGNRKSSAVLRFQLYEMCKRLRNDYIMLIIAAKRPPDCNIERNFDTV